MRRFTFKRAGLVLLTAVTLGAPGLSSADGGFHNASGSRWGGSNWNFSVGIDDHRGFQHVNGNGRHFGNRGNRGHRGQRHGNRHGNRFHDGPRNGWHGGGKHYGHGYGNNYSHGYGHGNRFEGRRHGDRKHRKAKYLIGGLIVGAAIHQMMRNNRNQHSSHSYVEQKPSGFHGSAPDRYLHKDIYGNCYEVRRGSDGNEYRTELSPGRCNW